GRSMDVCPIPITFFLRWINEGPAIRPMPMESISAEAQFYFGNFRKLPSLAYFVFRPKMDIKLTKHNTLIRNSIQAIQLWCISHIRIRLIELICTYPEYRLSPVGSFDKILTFKVGSGSSPLNICFYTEYPFLTKGIIKKGGVI